MVTGFADIKSLSHAQYGGDFMPVRSLHFGSAYLVGFTMVGTALRVAH